ncbi:MAG TPA: hypothetical protein VMI74_07480 [Burkholderiales bacterium]|nr:hypothetical protein [Burkholderiales bacterium]
MELDRARAVRSRLHEAAADEPEARVVEVVAVELVDREAEAARAHEGVEVPHQTVNPDEIAGRRYQPRAYGRISVPSL